MCAYAAAGRIWARKSSSSSALNGDLWDEYKFIIREARSFYKVGMAAGAEESHLLSMHRDAARTQIAAPSFWCWSVFWCAHIVGVVNKTAAFSVGRGPFFGLIRLQLRQKCTFQRCSKRVPISFEFSHQKCQNRLVKVRFMCEQRCIFPPRVENKMHSGRERNVWAGYLLHPRDAFTLLL